MRIDGREDDALRPVTIETGYLEFAEASVLISTGKTRVLCVATVEESVPPWMAGRGSGWVTAEYAMLPRSTPVRTRRETHSLSGRTQEIRRLIGRSLRASVNLDLLGERTVLIDCDVIQADGGTRTASITGGYVALALALRRLISEELIDPGVLLAPVAAVSVGLVDGQVLLDLCYKEDSTADVDMNVVMNADGDFVEVQGTAEGRLYSRLELDDMLDLAEEGIEALIAFQNTILRR
jgi:ribonuclease PH